MVESDRSTPVVSDAAVGHMGQGARAAISADHVSMRFGGITALSDVSFEVAVGERFGVIGPNGAGKSTLFAVLSGLLKPSDGSVKIFDSACTRWTQQRRVRAGMSRTFQTNSIFPELSVWDNVRVAAQLRAGSGAAFWHSRAGRNQTREHIESALDAVDLTQRAGDIAGSLSHGEARQLEVAISLASGARVLLLDEPAAGLSASERGIVRSLISNLDKGISLVLIEHDMSLVLDLVDRVLCLNNGNPVIVGTPSQVRDNEDVQKFYLGVGD